MTRVHGSIAADRLGGALTVLERARSRLVAGHVTERVIEEVAIELDRVAQILRDVAYDHRLPRQAGALERADADLSWPSSADAAEDDHLSPRLSMSWDLAPSIESASRSRRESRAACVAWGIDDATTAAVVDVVNELVSNALAHGAPPIVLRLEAAIDEVTVMVSDAADEPPRMLAYRPGITDRGLGLHLVTQLSEKWGATPGAAGKTVWATVGRAKPRGSVVREGR